MDNILTLLRQVNDAVNMIRLTRNGIFRTAAEREIKKLMRAMDELRDQSSQMDLSEREQVALAIAEHLRYLQDESGSTDLMVQAIELLSTLEQHLKSTITQTREPSPA